ncbi:AAA family ATPase [Aliihoeflea aestuarii]|uniref:TniB family NTP-binding protein n=1 Tax=Aliihoeflea aestuarii TaxID=453840 RepID=UPI0020942958|nr:TniB family NTP-binding protein [Aliihoeflea aestuarii]MCO6393254.1 AAA family ATPase [Aliihoeflea aestuarii]
MKNATENPTDQIARDLLKAYLKRDQDDVLEQRLQELIIVTDRVHTPRTDGDRVGRLAECKILALVGRSGAGKTRALERAFANRPEFSGLHELDAGCPLISLKAPSPCTLKQLGIEVLKALGYPLRRDPKEYEVWDMVRERLEMQGIRYLHIDEIQHVTAKANRNRVQNIRDTFKALVQRREWPVSLILSGTPDFVPFLEEDTQIKRRCLNVAFPDLNAEQDHRWVLDRVRKLIEKKTPLVDVEQDLEIITRLMHASEFQFGTLIEFVQDAALKALDDGLDKLRMSHFADVYAIRTGCPDDANVFASENWQSIVVGSALQDVFSPSPMPPSFQKVRVERGR